MKTIWKFPLTYRNRFSLSMPVGAEVISAGLDPQGALCIWAIVDPDASKESREVRIIGTGGQVPSSELLGNFVGTVCADPYMWHIFMCH